MELSSITPDVAGLRALSHPARLRMLGLLRSDGPATATTLAQRLRLNTGATSYHLRQLAQHGFVEDDPERGTGRERWWRATTQATTTEPAPPGDDAARDSLDAFLQSVVVVHTEQLQQAVEERGLLPDRWRRATTSSDWHVRLTAARAEALIEAIAGVLGDVEEDLDEPDAEEVVVQLHVFPRPGTVAGHEAGDPT
ncbi:ArsR/SmtB family transcription factor [Nocardioides sp. SYSU DS0663]|uniref:ArsR/SmtB family transcription factor n=1 Tax=Nocardioides sp. SYSU DS0663 TaxID=3416445 RepID=UPI003F4B7820